MITVHIDNETGIVVIGSLAVRARNDIAALVRYYSCGIDNMVARPVCMSKSPHSLDEGDH